MNTFRHKVIVVCLLLGAIGMFPGQGEAQTPGNFQGTWEADNADGLAFELDLTQHGEQLTGFHCGTTQDASRTDCSIPGDPPTLTGTVSNTVAKVRFTSAYSNQIGIARLTLQDESGSSVNIQHHQHESGYLQRSLLWEIIAFPNGIYYLPDRAVLNRVTNLSTRSLPAGSPLERLHELVSRDLQARAYKYIATAESAYTVYDDFNADSVQDIAAIFTPFAENIQNIDAEVRSEDRFLAVGFGDAAGGLSLAMNAQGVPCLTCGGVYGEPELSLHSENGILMLSSYGGSNWRWETIQKLRYEGDAFKVIGYTEASSHIGAGITLDYDLNLNTLEAVRSYNYGEGGKVRFRNLIANYAFAPIAIDGILNDASWQSALAADIRKQSAVVYKPENWSGTSDLSFSTAILWDSEALYIGINVVDDAVVPVKNWESILKGDHLELWFDFADSLINWDADGWPVRQKPDTFTLQLGIGVPLPGSLPEIRIFSPEKPRDTYGILAAASPTPEGYILEVRLPLNVFDEIDAFDHPWDAGRTFGLTVTLSDTDNAAKPRQDCLMATSEVQWGNPYTFGTCSFFEAYEKPDFPLTDWRARY